MGFYQLITSTRNTEPDLGQALSQLRTTIDSSIGGDWFYPAPAKLKKNTAWTAQQISQAQTILDTVATITPQREAQNIIDRWDISQKAFALSLIDAINVLRADITTLGINRSPITSAQAIAAIRAKAGTL